MKYLIFTIIISLPLIRGLCGRTNFVLVMTDDQGWGQTGYYNHPVLKTPNLDKMASNGLRFDQFYAGGPVCSPTRATVLTGRTHDRTGVFDHGYALRKQEKTLPQALQKVGYSTGHFGKWHLCGLRGPGVPILKSDTHGPRAFGFNKWLSVTNFFDLDPIMSRQGKLEEFKGDSSEIIVEEALSFMKQETKKGKPFFCVIWYGTPHSPWMALEEDMEEFNNLNKNSQAHYAELRAVDIFPTIAEIVGLPDSSMLKPVDGLSLISLFNSNITEREKPLIFSSRGRMAIIDNQWKMISLPEDTGRKIELYNLSTDPAESRNQFRPKHPQVIRLRDAIVKARISIEKSILGKDYPEENVHPQPPRIFWTELKEYQKFFPQWKNRPEYKSRLKKF